MPPKPFLTAAWRYLAMFNYEIDPRILAPYVPRGTDLDSWADRTYVSIVAFRFLDTRLLGVSVPFHRDFEEVNLRFYVRRVCDAQVRRAVVFIRELVPRRAVAAVARAMYNEPYITVPMHSRIATDPKLAVRYSWSARGRWHSLEARAAKHPTLPTAESLEEFISEHHWGYTRQRDGSTVEYHVSHPQWAVSPVEEYRIDADLEALYGPAFAPFLKTPASVFLADGSPVTVHCPTRLAGSRGAQAAA